MGEHRSCRGLLECHHHPDGPSATIVPAPQSRGPCACPDLNPASALLCRIPGAPSRDLEQFPESTTEDSIGWSIIIHETGPDLPPCTPNPASIPTPTPAPAPHPPLGNDSRSYLSERGKAGAGDEDPGGGSSFIEVSLRFPGNETAPCHWICPPDTQFPPARPPSLFTPP